MWSEGGKEGGAYPVEDGGVGVARGREGRGGGALPSPPGGGREVAALGPGSYIYIYIYIDSLLRRRIILSLSFSYRLDRQLLLRCNAVINIPGKGTEPHVLCSCRTLCVVQDVLSALV